MASRTSTRGSRSGSGRSSSSRPPAKKATGASAAKKATARKTGGFGAFLRAVIRALRTAWLATAHFMGAAVRRVGHGARDLDPALRRDGIGLLYAILAVVVGAVAWWGARGGLEPAISFVVSGAVGALDVLVPVFLVWMSWRTLRHPERRFKAHHLIGGLSGAVLRCGSGPRHRRSGSAYRRPGGHALRRRLGGLVGDHAVPVPVGTDPHGRHPLPDPGGGSAHGHRHLGGRSAPAHRRCEHLRGHRVGEAAAGVGVEARSGHPGGPRRGRGVRQPGGVRPRAGRARGRHHAAHRPD